MPYDTKLKSEEMDNLFSAILSLESVEECYMFFEDACTISELKAIAQRYEVARMLKDNVTYQDISKRTGASTATISRVNRCVEYGSGGYQLAMDRTQK